MSDPAPTPPDRPVPVASLTHPQFTAGKAIGEAFRLFRQSFARFGLVALALLAPAIVLDWALVAAPETSSGGQLGAVLWNVLGCLVTAALTRGTLEAVEGRPPAVPAMFGAAFRRGLRVLGASILVALLTIIGLVVVIVPGLIAAGLYLAVPSAVAEPGTSATASISRSWALTEGHRWATLGMALLFFAIPVAVVMLQAGLLEAFGMAGARVAVIISGIAMALALALEATAAATAYQPAPGR